MRRMVITYSYTRRVLCCFSNLCWFEKTQLPFTYFYLDNVSYSH